MVPHVRIATSTYAISNTTLVADGVGRCLLVDPGITVSDLVSLAQNIDALGLTVVAGFSTHAHWDHVLWTAAFGNVARYASARAVRLVQEERDPMVAEVVVRAPGHETWPCLPN